MTISPAFSPLIELRDGVSIPQLGLGVYKVGDAEATEVIGTAIDAGYRHIDTAKLYGNERGVGEAVRASGLAREELFVTTKVWETDQGYDETLRAFEASRARLGLEVVDLFLIHWPAPAQDKYVDTWRAMIRLQEDGVIRSIGVSNFTPRHLQRLIDETGVVPSINQVELHPQLQQRELRAFHDANGIATEAWSPLARGGALTDATLTRIATKHGVTTAQVVIRWHVQLGIVVIPKSVTPSRIRENADVFGFALDDDDLDAIAGMDEGYRTGDDPDAH